MRANARGFTLLEVMVATLIMSIAVVGLLSSLSTSLNNAAKLTAYDRAAQLARQKMDELLIATVKLPKSAPFEGQWDAATGWRARITTFEKPEGAGPLSPVLERVELEVWWMAGERRRTFNLEGYRRGALSAEEAPR